MDQNLKRVLPYYSAKAVLNTFQFLESHYPQYIFHDKYRNLTFSAVPFSYIKKYYSTKQGLRRILELSKLDPLQEKLKSFVFTLSELAGLPSSVFGVTGSILLDIHSPNFSDLDVTVHGLKNSIKIKQIMKDVLENGHPDISRLNARTAGRWQKDKAKRFGLSKADAQLLFTRKWNVGVFQNTRFSIHPIRNVNEIKEKYGDKTFIRKGRVEIQAKIIDSQALFLPSKFKIAKVNIIKGERVENIQEIVSFEGLFDASVEDDEFIKAKGQLELVKDNEKGLEYHQVVIGSSTGHPEEYILKI